MKKILSLVLALLMTVSCASLVFAAEDVADTAIAEEPTTTAVASPYAEAVEFLDSVGLMKGRDNYDLALEQPIKRYEMAIFVARLSTGWIDDTVWYEEYNKDLTQFDDLEGSGAINYIGAIRYAEGNKIIEGYGDHKFGPEDGITYQDALTMVLRTLGYGGKAYPWGYIEDAINLGLTENIERIAWTQPLTRDVVAQIIYNALFVVTAKGDTLANRIWNLDLNWQVVAITASNKGTLTPETATTSAGKFAFALVDTKTGEISKENVVVSIEKDPDTGLYPLDIEDDSAASSNLGHLYRVLFTNDAGKLYGICKWESLYNRTIWNKGIIETPDYPVNAFLDSVSIVTKYGDNTYLGTHFADKTQIIVKSALAGEVTVMEDTDLFKYAMNWQTGDIYELVAKADDKSDAAKDANNYKVLAGEKDKYKEYVYSKTPVWYWDTNMNLYFRFKLNTTNDKIIGVETMTLEDIEKLANTKVQKAVAYKGLLTLEKVGKTAYSSLDLFNVNKADDFGLYQEYGLGVYGGDNKFTPACSALAASYKLVKGEDYKPETITADKVELIDAIQADIAAPEKGDYVIYNYNAQTKVAKVVKVINQINDENNYVGYGVLRSYNVKDAKVVLSTGVTAVKPGDDKPYTFDYTDLKWNTLAKTSDNTWNCIYADYLDSLYNQYVKFAVVDGKLVDLRLEDADKATGKILVESYAGIANDGTIVVLGYNLTDAKMSYGFWRIATVNGWEFGDTFFYGRNILSTAYTRNYATDPSWCWLLDVKSYDKNTDTYFVTGEEAEFDPDTAKTFKLEYEAPYSVKVTEDGKDTCLVRTKSTDNYLFIVEDNNNDVHKTIVYTGLVKKGWSFEGYKIANNVYYIEDYDLLVGFNKETGDSYEYVVFLNYDANHSGYDKWQTVTGDWYLLGATTRVALCRDLFTLAAPGSYITLNTKLTNGKIYAARSGFIIGEADVDMETIIAEKAGNNTGNDFLKKYLETDKSQGMKDFSKEVVSYADAITKKYGKVDSDKHILDDLISGLKVYLVGKDGYTLTELTKDNFEKKIGGKDAEKMVPFYYIFKEGGDCTVYIFEKDITDNLEGEDLKTLAINSTPDTFEVKALKGTDGKYTGLATTGRVYKTVTETVTEKVDATVWEQIDGKWYATPGTKDVTKEVENTYETPATISYNEETGEYTAKLVSYKGDKDGTIVFTADADYNLTLVSVTWVDKAV
jgi:hypothetical protein